MKIEDGTLYIHQSDIANWRQCPEQVRHKLNNTYPDYDTDAAYIGTLTHEFIERCLTYAKETGKWPDPSLASHFIGLVADKLRGSWYTLWHHPHQVPYLEIGIDQLMGCCRMWQQHVQDTITTNPDEWEIEGSFDIKVGEVPYLVDSPHGGSVVASGPTSCSARCMCGWHGPDRETRSEADADMIDHTIMGSDHLSLDVHLRGHIDFFDGRTVWDWKTGDLREKWRKQRYDVQSTVYTWAKGVNQMHFVHMPRGKKEPITCDVYRYDAHWEMMKTEVMAIARAVTSLDRDQVWPLGATDWWCSERWCAIHAQGKCMGAANPIYPEESVYLTSLIERGVPFDRHGDDF